LSDADLQEQEVAMGKWILTHEPDEPPVRWQCVLCETPVGQPHKKRCKCKLVEGVPISEIEEMKGGEDGKKRID